MTIAGAIMICFFGNGAECTTYNKQFETVAECEYEAAEIKKKIEEQGVYEFAGHACVDTSK